jgi:hypothetical protein
MHKFSGQQHVARDFTTPLQRTLNFAGVTIHDVINCPVARRKALAFHRLGNHIRRKSEAVDLERQWNPLGIRHDQ